MRRRFWNCAAICFSLLVFAGCTPEGPGESSPADDVGADVYDSGSPVDAGDTAEAEPDSADGTATDGDDGGDGRRTLADYQRCTSDAECPVGTGRCIEEVPLRSVSEDGRDAIPVSELFEQVADGEGICTEACTDATSACDDLSVSGDDEEPYTCQMVWSDPQAPYPDQPPAFPFDEQLDDKKIAEGVSFGAICRPPFQLDPAVSESMCQSCGADAETCGDGSLCWNLADGAPAGEGSGTCLAGCGGAGDCPAGFACDATGPDGGQFCRPVENTCTDCVDRDGDDVGTGRCQPDGTVSGYDCDDTDPTIYYDEDNPSHPFPEHCGEHDYNCNGLSDAAEQIGSKAFGSDHCTACGDTCGGDVDHGMLTCSKIMVDGTATPVCNASCETDEMGNLTHEDCNGRQAMDGCETSVDDSDAQVYADMDGDGYGDPMSPKFLCGEQMPSAGYVDNKKDCDDSDATVYQGAAEVCDDKDNDCDGTVDNGFDTKGDTCSVGQGICKKGGGTKVCNMAGDDVICNLTPGMPDSSESCNGLDDDCDGSTDEDFPRKDSVCYVGLGVCKRSGTFVCNGAGDDVECNATPGSRMEVPEITCNGKDDDCDGSVDEGVKTAYYRDNDDDGHGAGSAKYQCMSPGMNWVTNNDDCSGGDTLDLNATIYKGAGERCDGNRYGTKFDNDCDGTANEGCPTSISGSGSTIPKRVYIKPGSWTSTYECDDGYVVGNLEVVFNHSNHRGGTIAWVLPVCEPISLYDPDNDGVLDGITLQDTSTRKQYTKARDSDYVGAGHDTTTSTLYGSDTPAEVITGLVLEDHDPHPAAVGRLRAKVTELGIKEPYQTGGASEVEVVGTSDAKIIGRDSRFDKSNAVGIEPPDKPREEFAHCDAGQVAVGIKVYQFDHYYSSNVDDIALLCQKISLTTK